MEPVNRESDCRESALSQWTKRRRPGGARGAHEHEAKEHDLPVVRRGSARGCALLRRHFSGQQSNRCLRGAPMTI
jgi:hypothetical protein